jgi:hypothetical protein
MSRVKKVQRSLRHPLADVDVPDDDLTGRARVQGLVSEAVGA